MTNKISLTILLFFCFSVSYAQIIKKFKDQKNDNRTVVIKENVADDYQILESDFKDAEVGQVIRITTAKAPKEKVEREPVVQEKSPPPVVERKVSHGPPPPKVYRKIKKRYKPVKRKQYNKKKRYSCFIF